MPKFKVTDVEFDTDGDKALNKSLKKKYIGWVFEADNEEDAGERVLDIVSDDSCFCIFHISYKEVLTQKEMQL